VATAKALLKELKHVLYESPYDGFWTDAMLYGYMAEGQDRFCADTGYFVDPVNYFLTTVIDQQSYEFSDRIIKILNVYDAGRPLTRFEEQSKEAWTNPTVMDYEFSGTRLQGFQTDFAPGYVTLWPIPVDVRTLTMRVWRYARKHLCQDGPSTETEIPPQFDRAIIEYAAWKAFNHHDQELQDVLKANDHLAAYKQYVADGVQAFSQLRGSETRVAPSPVYVV
jgi:hypothetical protein